MFLASCTDLIPSQLPPRASRHVHCSPLTIMSEPSPNPPNAEAQPAAPPPPSAGAAGGGGIPPYIPPFMRNNPGGGGREEAAADRRGGEGRGDIFVSPRFPREGREGRGRLNICTGYAIFVDKSLLIISRTNTLNTKPHGIEVKYPRHGG